MHRTHVAHHNVGHAALGKTAVKVHALVGDGAGAVFVSGGHGRKHHAILERHVVDCERFEQLHEYPPFDGISLPIIAALSQKHVSALRPASIATQPHSDRHAPMLRPTSTHAPATSAHPHSGRRAPAFRLPHSFHSGRHATAPPRLPPAHPCTYEPLLPHLDNWSQYFRLSAVAPLGSVTKQRTTWLIQKYPLGLR